MSDPANSQEAVKSGNVVGTASGWRKVYFAGTSIVLSKSILMRRACLQIPDFSNFETYAQIEHFFAPSTRQFFESIVEVVVFQSMSVSLLISMPSTTLRNYE